MTFDVNVLGPISLTRLLAPHMLKRGRGHFVVVFIVFMNYSDLITLRGILPKKFNLFQFDDRHASSARIIYALIDHFFVVVDIIEIKFDHFSFLN